MQLQGTVIQGCFFSFSVVFLTHRYWSKTNIDSTSGPACGNRFTFLLQLFCFRGGCFKQRFNLPELCINRLVESPAQVTQRSEDFLLVATHPREHDL